MMNGRIQKIFNANDINQTVNTASLLNSLNQASRNVSMASESLARTGIEEARSIGNIYNKETDITGQKYRNMSKALNTYGRNVTALNNVFENRVDKNTQDNIARISKEQADIKDASKLNAAIAKNKAISDYNSERLFDIFKKKLPLQLQQKAAELELTEKARMKSLADTLQFYKVNGIPLNGGGLGKSFGSGTTTNPRSIKTMQGLTNESLKASANNKKLRNYFSNIEETYSKLNNGKRLGLIDNNGNVTPKGLKLLDGLGIAPKQSVNPQTGEVVYSYDMKDLETKMPNIVNALNLPDGSYLKYGNNDTLGIINTNYNTITTILQQEIANNNINYNDLYTISKDSNFIKHYENPNKYNLPEGEKHLIQILKNKGMSPKIAYDAINKTMSIANGLKKGIDTIASTDNNLFIDNMANDIKEELEDDSGNSHKGLLLSALNVASNNIGSLYNLDPKKLQMNVYQYVINPNGNIYKSLSSVGPLIHMGYKSDTWQNIDVLSNMSFKK